MQLKEFYWADIFIEPLSKSYLRRPLYLRCYVEQVEVRFIFGKKALLALMSNPSKRLEKQAWRERVEVTISNLVKKNKEFKNILRRKLQAEWRRSGVRLSCSIPIFQEDFHGKGYQQTEKPSQIPNMNSRLGKEFSE